MKRYFFVIVLFSLPVVLLQGALHAESPPAITMEQVRALAFAKSPVIRSIDAQYAAGVGAAIELAVLKNPSLSAETQFSMHPRVNAGDNQIVASIDQPLRLSDFGSRARVAELMNQSAQMQQKIALLELSQDLRVQYVRLWSEREFLRGLLEAQKNATEKVGLVRDAVSKGLVTLGESRILEGEVARLKSQVLGVQATISLSESELFRISGCDLRKGSLEKPEVSPLPDLTELQKLGTTSPLSPAMRSELASRLAQEGTRLAELDQVGTLVPRVVYEHTNDGSDFVGAGITIPFGIWDRNQGQRQIAQARHLEQQAQADFLKNGGLERQIEMLYRAAQSTQQQLVLFRSEVVPSFRSAFESQEKEFRSGKGGVMQLWQSLRASNDAREQELALYLKSAEIRSQLSVFVGQEM